MDSRHTLQAGTRPEGARGERCFLITLMILIIAGLLVLLAAVCTLWTWSVRLISTTRDQRHLYVPRPSACHTARRTNHIAPRDRRSLTGRVEADKSSSRMDVRRSVGEPLHPQGLHGINTYLALSRNHAKAFNKTNCWVCTKRPHSAVTGRNTSVGNTI